MNPLEQIDAVFLWLKSKVVNGGYYGYYNIENYFNRMHELKINPTILKEILKLLVEDGYVSERKIAPGQVQPVYNVTFKGMMFDGYGAAKKQIDANEEWSRKISTATLNNANRANWLNAWLVIFTAIAALYYCIEIYKYCIEKDEKTPVESNLVMESTSSNI